MGGGVGRLRGDLSSWGILWPPGGVAATGVEVASEGVLYRELSIRGVACHVDYHSMAE